MHRIRPALLASALAAAVALAGCGGQPAHVPAAPVQAGPTTGVLPVTALSRLAVVTVPLSARAVEKDANLRGLAARLSRWGYVGGWQRTFQGESRRLTLVVSRSLRFRTRSGAAGFVAYLGSHAGAFYPFATVSRLTVAGQAGWLIKPPMCACHLAEPLYAGVTASGRQVRWLEINGPVATPRLVASLLARSS